MRSRGFRHDGYDCFFRHSGSVEGEGESSSNSLREKKKRLENVLAAVSDVPLLDVRLVRACVLETFEKTSDVNVVMGSQIVI
ncbi:hypothetical protein Tco_1148868 [Tanacetum coccineum]